MKTHLFTLVIALVFISNVNAQTTVPDSVLLNSQVYKVVLVDGSSFDGVILKSDTASILFKTPVFSELPVFRTSIKSIFNSSITASKLFAEKKQLKNKNQDAFEIDSITGWVENQHYSRYFFGPSAFQLKKGEGYYQCAYLFVNSVNFGFTDHFSIGFGAEILSTFSGNPTLFVTPKFGFELSKNLNVGFGAMTGFFGIDETKYFLVGFANITLGDHNTNITFNIGNGKLTNEMTPFPVMTINGMFRVGKRFSLITENWLIPFEENANTTLSGRPTYKYNGIISYGMRYFNNNFSFDIGFLNNAEISELIPIGIPYVDVVIKF